MSRDNTKTYPIMRLCYVTNWKTTITATTTTTTATLSSSIQRSTEVYVFKCSMSVAFRSGFEFDVIDGIYRAI